MKDDACLMQIRYWNKAIQQSSKAINRKNKRINSLQRENLRLNRLVSTLMIRLAELEDNQ